MIPAQTSEPRERASLLVRSLETRGDALHRVCRRLALLLTVRLEMEEHVPQQHLHERPLRLSLQTAKLENVYAAGAVIDQLIP